jgi:AcrR family transcriptional regulator
LQNVTRRCTDEVLYRSLDPPGDAQDVGIGSEVPRRAEREAVEALDAEAGPLDYRGGVAAAMTAAGDPRPEGRVREPLQVGAERMLGHHAAAQVFARRGFGGASVDEVAEAAGYTKGAVYSNFGSKDELFLAVLQYRMRRQVELLDGLAERAHQAPEEVPLLLPDLDSLDQQWCLLIFEFWLYALRNPASGERLGSVYRAFRSNLAPLLAPYAGNTMRPQELAAAGIALFQGLALQRHLDPDAVGVDFVVRLLGALRDAA